MSKDPAWERHRSNLVVQAKFVRPYSPLTAALLEQVVEWLGDPEGQGEALGDPKGVRGVCERIAKLLTEDDIEGIDTGWIDDLQPALRLNAALHWYVLQGDPRVEGLRPYYSTVPEGRGPEARKLSDPDFGHQMLLAAKALGPELFERASNWHVVTNETSRGIAWLLPAVCVGAEAVHLVELGCGVGLNLYAEQRHYDLAWASSKRLRMGRGDPQFLTRCEGTMPDLAGFSETERRGPEVLTRVGGDRHSKVHARPEYASHLEASVFGDQPGRLARFREGMKIHWRARELGIEPAEVVPLELPGDLGEFLDRAVPSHPEVPVVTYNTYVTASLSDVNQRAVARDMRAYARAWALRHGLPWMWVRFEPPRDGRSAPHPGWCLWIVELFARGKHKSIELGWAHPHLARVEFGPGLIKLRGLRDRR